MEKNIEKTYKITLPKGARVYTIESKVDNGMLEVTVNIEKKYMPKDGDIVCRNICNDDNIVIYAGTDKDGVIATYAALYGHRLQTVRCEKGWGCTYEYRPATETEKQRLFDALAKDGKRWNAETKQIEDLPRWRAEENESYYYVDLSFNVKKTDELRCYGDNNLYDAGNYFRTREAAEKVASQIRGIFKNSKAE